MKNTLFSTIGNAVDNVSIIVKCSDEDAVREAVLTNCKYNAFTINPVGDNPAAVDMDEFIEQLKAIRLHVHEIKKVKTTLEIIDLGEDFNVTREGNYDVKVRLRTIFAKRTPHLVAEERDLIDKIFDVFDGHIGYGDTRNEFIVEPYELRTEKETKHISFGIVDDRLVKMTDIYTKKLVEL